MQITWRAHKPLRLAAAPILSLSVVLAALFLAMTAPALARDYSMPHVRIDAEVADTGDVHIAEQRQFDSDGSLPVLRWTFNGLPAGASVRVHGVTLREGPPDTAADQTPRSVPGVPFDSTWRNSGGPGTEAYSWDGGQSTLYVFPDAVGASIVVTVDYTVANGAVPYKDVADLCWRYVGPDWPVASNDVIATVKLPVPAGQRAIVGQNVLVWGHGPLDGRVEANSEGTVTCTVPAVLPGQHSETRIVFPASWLSGASESTLAEHANETHLETVLADEQRWADTANAQRTQSLLFAGFWFLLSLAMLGWAVAAFLRRGKEHHARFTGEYWRGIPDENLSPAQVGRLLSGNAENPRDFTATLMELTRKGLLRVRGNPRPENRGTDGADYLLISPPQPLDHIQADDVERRAISLIFGTIGNHADQVWLGDVSTFAKKHPEAFSHQMASWQRKLSSAMERDGLFEKKSESLQSAMKTTAGVYALAALIVAFLSGNPVPLIPMLPTSLLLVVISRFMPRRSRRGAEVAAKAQALKRWLQDFAKLDEDIPADVATWSELLVYAHLFGISEQVVQDLLGCVPAFRGMDRSRLHRAVAGSQWVDIGAYPPPWEDIMQAASFPRQIGDRP